jgi:hypothetical protein
MTFGADYQFFGRDYQAASLEVTRRVWRYGRGMMHEKI